MSVAWIVVFWTALAVFLYAQVGYMLLLRLIARPRRHAASPAADSPQWPSVTLIIPAHDEESVLEAKLDNSLAIDYPTGQLDVLVASDGSSDRTVEIARSFENRGVRVLAFTERRGKTAVLNDAMGQAKGDVVCVCDANVMFRPDALKRLVARLDDPRIGAVSADVRLESQESDFGEGESAYYRIERTVQMAESRIGSMMGVDGGMYVLRRELFQPLPPDTIVDDFVVSMRVIRQGKRVVYEPTAVATENATATARQEFRRRVRLSAGAMQVLKRAEWPPLLRPVEVWQFMSHKVLRWAGPLWLVVLLVSSAVLASAGILLYQVAFFGQVALYAVAVLGVFCVRIRDTRIGGITFYFAMSHVAMALGLAKGLLNIEPVAWRRTERTVPCKGSSATTGLR